MWFVALCFVFDIITTVVDSCEEVSHVSLRIVRRGLKQLSACCSASEVIVIRYMRKLTTCSIKPQQITNIFMTPSNSWIRFPYYWPCAWGIHWSPVNAPPKGPVMQSFEFSMLSACLNKPFSKQSNWRWFQKSCHPRDVPWVFNFHNPWGPFY